MANLTLGLAEELAHERIWVNAVLPSIMGYRCPGDIVRVIVNHQVMAANFPAQPRRDLLPAFHEVAAPLAFNRANGTDVLALKAHHSAA